MKNKILLALAILLLWSAPVSADIIVLHETTADLGGAFGNDFKLTMYENWVNQGLMNTEIYGLATDIQTSLGITAGAEHFGTFTGTTITDNQALKTVLQELETAIEGIEVGGLADLDDLPGDTVDDNLIDFTTLAGVQATLTDPIVAAGAQSITGIKTFTASPIVPTPTTDMQTSTKKYVDDGLAGKANSTGISFLAGALSDMKILDSAQPVTGQQLVLDTLAYGDADDALHLWSIDKIGAGLALKQDADADLTDLADGSLTASKVGDGLYVADDCTTVSTPATGAICFEY